MSCLSLEVCEQGLGKIFMGSISSIEYQSCKGRFGYCCCCSVSQSCVTICDLMDCSTPGFPVHHHLWELISVESVMSSNHLILCCLLLILPSIFSSIRVFSNESALRSGGQSIGASASASVSPMHIQDWFPLGWTGLISLQSKGLSRVFSSTTVQKHQFFFP